MPTVEADRRELRRGVTLAIEVDPGGDGEAVIGAQVGAGGRGRTGGAVEFDGVADAARHHLRTPGQGSGAGADGVGGVGAAGFVQLPVMHQGQVPPRHGADLVAEQGAAVDLDVIHVRIQLVTPAAGPQSATDVELARRVPRRRHRGGAGEDAVDVQLHLTGRRVVGSGEMRPYACLHGFGGPGAHVRRRGVGVAAVHGEHPVILAGAGVAEIEHRGPGSILAGHRGPVRELGVQLHPSGDREALARIDYRSGAEVLVRGTGEVRGEIGRVGRARLSGRPFDRSVGRAVEAAA